MNKPHIDKLYYSMVVHTSVDYKKASPATDETEIFIMTARDKKVIFDIKQHYESVEKIRRVTDEYLKQWEILIGLKTVPSEITFKFEHADIIDLEPDRDSGIVRLLASSVKAVSSKSSPGFHISRDKYPDPPSGFSVSPDVDTMFFRYKAYHEGQDHLASMAYLVLTILEMSSKTRLKASQKYNISETILDKLAKLCANQNQGEKQNPSMEDSFAALSSIDKAWMLAACRLIIKRKGEYENCGSSDGLPALTMDDLPLLI